MKKTFWSANVWEGPWWWLSRDNINDTVPWHLEYHGTVSEMTEMVWLTHREDQIIMDTHPSFVL